MEKGQGSIRSESQCTIIGSHTTCSDRDSIRVHMYGALYLQDRTFVPVGLPATIASWRTGLCFTGKSVIVAMQAISTQGLVFYRVIASSVGVCVVMRHHNNLVGKLCSCELEQFGFDVTTCMSKEEVEAGGYLELAESNAMAHEMAMFTLGMLGCRLKRNLYLWGSWPVRSCIFVSSDPAVRDEALAELRSKHGRYLQAKALGHPHMKRLVAASMFETVPCQQLVTMLQQANWTLTPAIIEHCSNTSKRFVTSQLCEDGFNRCKRQVTQAANHEMSNSRVFHTLLKTSVIQQVHNYKAPDTTSYTVPRGVCLGDHMFQGLEKDVWLRLREIRGHGEPKWYSPGGNNWWDHVVHDALLAYATQAKLLMRLGETWKCCLLQNNCLVVKNIRSKVWHFVVGQASAEGFFGWPAKMSQLDEAGGACFVPATGEVDFEFLFVIDENQWEGYFVEWLSPLSQRHKGHQQSVALRAHTCEPGPARPILHVAASRAFYSLPRTTLTRLASDLKVAVPPSASMFDLVFVLVKHVLAITDEQVCEILRLRTLRARGEDICAKQLHDSGECDEILDRDDRADLHAARNASDGKAAEITTFSSQLKEKRKAVKAASGDPKTKPSSSGRRKQSSSKKVHVPRVFPMSADDITQPAAKLLLPPNSFIWRSLRSCAWMGRYPPFGSHVRSWFQHGHSEALRQVLQCVWDDYLLDNEQSRADCPIEGLFLS